MKRFFCAAGVCLLLAATPARAEPEWRAPSPAQRALDAAAFDRVSQAIMDSLLPAAQQRVSSGP